MQLQSHNGVRIAVEGCGHGVLHSIYASVDKACAELGWDSVDLVIIGGDFQAVRNAPDLACMSIPTKFRAMHDFHEYYAGTRRAPYLTIFIGGNHEASNYLFELFYGGWAAPNIYYLGAANVIRFGPLRIAGLSGIWKGYSYNKPHLERIPYNQDDVKSAYHVREYDVRKLLQIRSQVDIGLSHDWPRAVELDGDFQRLFHKKPDFRTDSEEGKLGSVAARYLLDRLRPRYWFSAHLHCKFSAVVRHRHVGDAPTTALTITPAKNDEEIDLDMDDDDGDEDDGDEDDTPSAANNSVPEDIRAQLPGSFAPPQQTQSNVESMSHPEAIGNTTTKFLALDKCLKNRGFLQLIHVDQLEQSDASSPAGPFRLEYDPEWLAITRVFAQGLVVGDFAAQVPPNRGEAHYLPLIQNEEQWVRDNLVQPDKMTIPENFAVTAPIYDPQSGLNTGDGPREYTNNQTVAYCKLLEIPNPFDISEDERAARLKAGPRPAEPRLEQHHGGRGRGQSYGHRGGRGGGRGGSRGAPRGSRWRSRGH